MSEDGSVQVRAGLQAGHLAPDHRLRSVLGAYERRRDRLVPAVEDGRFWTASFFGLDQVTRFRALPAERRAEIEVAASQMLLEEALRIETAGMAYCAKLTLLSETVEERKVFSHQGADEASHLRVFEAWLPQGAGVGSDPFTALLSTLIEQGERQTLLYTLQVVLEGWGLHHYRSLRQGTRCAALGTALEAILRDEALHVGTGKALYRPEQVGAGERAVMKAFLGQLLEMVRVGPQRVVALLEQACGGLSVPDRATVFAELEGPRTSRATLELLEGLLGDAPTGVLTELEAQGAFEPYDEGTCAALAGSLGPAGARGETRT